MDTNVIIAIVAVVVIAALLAIGGWWFGKSRKSAVDKSTEVAKAKADARLATEKSAAQSAAASAENAEKTKETAESAATEAVESATSSATPESPVATEPTPVGSAVTESATPAVETPEAAGTRMQRLKARLSKSGNPFGKALFNILAKDQLSEADWEDVEDTLLLADVGAEASEQLVEELRNDARIAGQSDPAEVRAALKDKLLRRLLAVSMRKNLSLSQRIFCTTPKTVRGRLLTYFSAQAARCGRMEFEVPFNRQQMADYLNLDRSALSKELCKMRDEGLLEFDKNRFVLKQLPE